MEDILLDEAKRLNRINEMIEKAFLKSEITYREPEQIRANIYLMLEISKHVKWLKKYIEKYKIIQ